MTITPEQARKLNEEDQARIGELEKRIDWALGRDFGKTGGRVCITVGYVDNRTLQEVSRMYGGAGWDVEYESDQRDGDFLAFTPKGNYQGGDQR
ncbi:MAG: hypothetical protein KJ600_03875 [Nanoarchaeota archaeon]|nr:hypothetical protein [Nanoarchaeota archaeon]MBU1103666.1 hypothetical protein [Nanoarchaeota archaeon]